MAVGGSNSEFLKQQQGWQDNMQRTIGPASVLSQEIDLGLKEGKLHDGVGDNLGKGEKKTLDKTEKSQLQMVVDTRRNLQIVVDFHKAFLEEFQKNGFAVDAKEKFTVFVQALKDYQLDNSNQMLEVKTPSVSVLKGTLSALSYEITGYLNKTEISISKNLSAEEDVLALITNTKTEINKRTTEKLRNKTSLEFLDTAKTYQKKMEVLTKFIYPQLKEMQTHPEKFKQRLNDDEKVNLQKALKGLESLLPLVTKHEAFIKAYELDGFSDASNNKFLEITKDIEKYMQLHQGYNFDEIIFGKILMK